MTPTDAQLAWLSFLGGAAIGLLFVLAHDLARVRCALTEMANASDLIAAGAIEALGELTRQPERVFTAGAGETPERPEEVNADARVE